MNTLLVLHGFMGVAEDFDFLKSEFKDDYDQILTPTLPGHLDNSEEYKDWFSFIIQLYTTYITPQNSVDLVGYSLGGRIAIALLEIDEKSKRNKINKIILESAAPGISSKIDRARRLEHDESLFNQVNTKQDFEAFLEYWIGQPLFYDLKSQIDFPRWRETRLQHSVNNLQSALGYLSTGAMEDYTDFIANCRNKIHYLYGQKDQKYKDIAQSYFAPYKHKLHEFKGAGHNCHHPGLETTYLKTLHQILSAPPRLTF